jgi:hypothetical protein
MAWVYRITSGQLSHEGDHTRYGGYSGFGPHKNDPTAVALHDAGPICPGLYTIGKPYDSAHVGPFALPLIPDATNEMWGRGDFKMHGDSKTAPGTASHGCIIQARATRAAVAASGDTRLQVVKE